MPLSQKKFRHILVMRDQAPAPRYIGAVEDFADAVTLVRIGDPGVVDRIKDSRIDCVILDCRGVDSTLTGLLLSLVVRKLPEAELILIHNRESQLREANLLTREVFGLRISVVHANPGVDLRDLKKKLELVPASQE